MGELRFVRISGACDALSASGRFGVEKVARTHCLTGFECEERWGVDMHLRAVDSLHWDSRAIFSAIMVGDGAEVFLDPRAARGRLIHLDNYKLRLPRPREVAEDLLVLARNQHTVPINSLVEIGNGARLFVVAYLRGSRWRPEYGLGAETRRPFVVDYNTGERAREIDPYDDGNGSFASIRVIEDEMRVIRVGDGSYIPRRWTC